MTKLISQEAALYALCRAVHNDNYTIPCPNQIVSCTWKGTRVQEYAEEILSIPPIEWISVKDRLPEFAEEVLVTDGKDYAVGNYRYDAKAWDSCNFGWLENRNSDDCPPGIKTVTHWMPLPKLPKELE